MHDSISIYKIKKFFKLLIINVTSANKRPSYRQGTARQRHITLEVK